MKTVKRKGWIRSIGFLLRGGSPEYSLNSFNKGDFEISVFNIICFKSHTRKFAKLKKKKVCKIVSKQLMATIQIMNEVDKIMDNRSVNNKCHFIIHLF